MAVSLRNRRYGTRHRAGHSILECRAERDYSLWLRFDDGLEGVVYLADLVATDDFCSWADIDRFLGVSIDPVAMTVQWEDGIRLDPEALYRDVVSKVKMALH